MNKSIPRIGRQEFLNGLDLLVQMVGFQDDITENELEEQMEEENRRMEKQPFKDVDEWINFAFDDSGTSLEILHRDERGNVELTDDGEDLLDADDFVASAFNLLEKKSAENFRYFHYTLQAFDQRVKAGKYDLGSNLVNEINTLMSDTGKGNSVTAGTIAGILRDFEVVVKRKGGWEIEPSTYSNLRGRDKSLVLDLVRQEGNQMPLTDLENALIMTFDWSEEKIQGVIDSLRENSRIHISRYEGKEHVEVLD